MESTFQEVRQRLGFETQRHWSESAVQRTAPILLGLFSVITLLAHVPMAKKGANTVRRATCYEKKHPNFSDALALVRKELWAQQEATCYGWEAETEMVKVPREFMNG